MLLDAAWSIRLWSWIKYRIGNEAIKEVWQNDTLRKHSSMFWACDRWTVDDKSIE